MSDTTVRYCKKCGTETPHEADPRPSAGCAGHAVLTAITCGLWIPLAACLGALAALLPTPERCRRCGNVWKGAKRPRG